MSEEFKPEGLIPGWTSYKIHNPDGPLPYYPPPSPRRTGRLPRWLWFIFGVGIGLSLWWIFAPAYCHAKQTQPDSKRVKQIQTALVDHNYPAGQTWQQTQEILRGIAKDHNWQVNRAPDARVLILLGLGNEHSDQSILTEPPNFLERKSDGE